MALQANPLKKYSSYNYRWALSGAYVGEIGSVNYLESGGNIPIIRSGGLSKDKAVTTAAEDALGINVEFFIDDVNIDSLVSHNPGTSTSTATTINFIVKEPYSIGLFIQTLHLAATKGGFSNYIEAPYILSLDFMGIEPDGSITNLGIRKSLCIKFVNITFTSDASGTTYEIEAIPYNHLAFVDEVQNIRTNIRMIGDTVEALLCIGENSLVSELNRISAERAGAGEIDVPDSFRISFPADVSSAGSAPSILQRNFTGLTTGELASAGADQFLRRVTSQSVTPTPTAAVTGGRGSVVESLTERADYLAATAASVRSSVQGGRGSVVESLTERANYLINQGKATISANSNANYIGRSRIISDFNNFGNNQFGIEGFQWDGQVFQRGNLTISPTERVFQYSEGNKIEKIIEDVILTSEWGQQILNQQVDNRTGDINWFKITTTVTPTSGGNANGRPSHEFHYVVTPYRVHASAISANFASQNYTARAEDAVKGFYYSYTGLNEDIINFEFRIDNSFFKTLSNNNTAGSSQRQDSLGGPMVGSPTTTFAPNRNGTVSSNGTPVNRIEYTDRMRTTVGGAGIDNEKIRAAHIFNQQILNSDTDNVEVTLTIWGDPYFLSQSDMGNYFAGSGGPNQTVDNDIDFVRGEVDCLLTFNSGIDYVGNLMAIDPANAFSGVYRVITLTSSFSGGKFTQEIKMLRRPNQDQQSVDFSNFRVLSLRNAISGDIQDAVRQQLQPVANAFQPLLQELPTITSTFARLSQIDLTSIERISGLNIFETLGGVSQLISSATQLQSNLLSSLGNIGPQIPGFVESFNIPDAAIGNLNSALQNAIPQLTGALNSVVTQLPDIGSVVNGNLPVFSPSSIIPNTSNPQSPTVASPTTRPASRPTATTTPPRIVTPTGPQ